MTMLRRKQEHTRMQASTKKRKVWLSGSSFLPLWQASCSCCWSSSSYTSWASSSGNALLMATLQHLLRTRSSMARNGKTICADKFRAKCNKCNIRPGVLSKRTSQS
uniref:Putative secreted protein n=1 Tax=Amblyomma cajennense TaxID=34607 RepID=A0A023FBP7_AMBCJ